MIIVLFGLTGDIIGTVNRGVIKFKIVWSTALSPRGDQIFYLNLVLIDLYFHPSSTHSLLYFLDLPKSYPILVLIGLYISTTFSRISVLF